MKYLLYGLLAFSTIYFLQPLETYSEDGTTICTHMFYGARHTFFGFQPACAVDIPPSYIENLTPPNMTQAASDPATAINTYSTGLMAPITDKLGIWTGPFFSFGIGLAMYAATRNFVYTAMIGMIIILGVSAAIPTQVHWIVNAILLAGWGGALWYGVKKG